MFSLLIGVCHVRLNLAMYNLFKMELSFLLHSAIGSFKGSYIVDNEDDAAL